MDESRAKALLKQLVEEIHVREKGDEKFIVRESD